MKTGTYAARWDALNTSLNQLPDEPSWNLWSELQGPGGLFPSGAASERRFEGWHADWDPFLRSEML